MNEPRNRDVSIYTAVHIVAGVRANVFLFFDLLGFISEEYPENDPLTCRNLIEITCRGFLFPI